MSPAVVNGATCDCGEQHGGQVEFVSVAMIAGGRFSTLRHVGQDEHDEIPEGHRCRCGAFNLGVVRSDSGRAG